MHQPLLRAAGAAGFEKLLAQMLLQMRMRPSEYGCRSHRGCQCKQDCRRECAYFSAGFHVDTSFKNLLLTLVVSKTIRL